MKKSLIQIGIILLTIGICILILEQCHKTKIDMMQTKVNADEMVLEQKEKALNRLIDTLRIKDKTIQEHRKRLAQSQNEAKAATKRYNDLRHLLNSQSTDTIRIIANLCDSTLAEVDTADSDCMKQLALVTESDSLKQQVIDTLTEISIARKHDVATLNDDINQRKRKEKRLRIWGNIKMGLAALAVIIIESLAHR